MLKDRGKSHCSVKITPLPEFIVCTRCGEEVELWSDEEETICCICGHRIFRREMTVH